MPPLEDRIDSLARRVERLTGTDGEHSTSISALKLYRSSRRTKPTACILDPSLCLVLQGRKRALSGAEVFRYDPSNYLVIMADSPMVSEITHASAREPYLCARVWIDLGVAGEVLASLPPRLDHAEARALAVQPVDDGLLGAVERLVCLLDEPAHAPVIAPLVLREITYRLLVGDVGARLRQLVAGDGSGRRVGRALVIMKARFAEPLGVEALAREVGMSVSAFHHQFKRVTGMSPLQYQKQLRLHEARRLLLSGELDAGQASFRVGYESPSQFSREYARLFGAPPRRDVTALLAADRPNV